jgi:hypothetical protein
MKIVYRSLTKIEHLLWGYPMEFAEKAEKLQELFLNQNITNLKNRSFEKKPSRCSQKLFDRRKTQK